MINKQSTQQFRRELLYVIFLYICILRFHLWGVYSMFDAVVSLNYVISVCVDV